MRLSIASSFDLFRKMNRQSVHASHFATKYLNFLHGKNWMMIKDNILQLRAGTGKPFECRLTLAASH